VKTATNHSITEIIKNKLIRLLDFCGDAGDTLELEAILFQMCDMCVHFGPMYKHYSKLDSQLTCEIRFLSITNLTHFFPMYLFISLLYMFRATQCSSSGESNCINTSSGIEGVTGGTDQTSGGCSLC